MKFIKQLAMIAAPCILVSAAGPAQGANPQSSESEDESGQATRLGPEVDRICFGRSINRWREVKGEDNVVLLARGASDWYRVELMGMCSYRVLRFAHAIELDQRPGGGCVRRGDRIIVRERPSFEYRCTIVRMYEWDPDAPAGDEDSQ